MTYIAIIGSGKFKAKPIVINWLKKNIKNNEDTIVSGHSPRNSNNKHKKPNNVDIWAEDWAYDNCVHHPLIFYAEKYTQSNFFKRNEDIAFESEKIVAFIPEGQYKSGAWNTIHQFVMIMCRERKHVLVIGYDGIWDKKSMPKWFKTNTRIKVQGLR